MADKRISQLIERTDIANNDVLPIVASGATTTNKVTISTIQDWMQDNLDVGVTSVGITLGTTGTDVNVSGSPITTSGNITINIPDASASARGVVTTGSQNFAGNKSFQNTIFVNAGLRLDQNGTALPTFVQNISGTGLISSGSNGLGFNSANNLYFSGSEKGGAVLAVNNSAVRTYTLQDANGTLAFTSDLSGYVTLGTAQTITAQKTFSTSGSSDTAIINHGSGSGIALNITKAGNGEGLRVAKTSGSGNAVTITGGVLSAEAGQFSGDLQTSTRISATSGSNAITITPNVGGTQNRIETTGTLPLSLVSADAITLAAGGTTPQITLATTGAATFSGALNGTSATFSGLLTTGNDVNLTNSAYVYSSAGGSGVRSGIFLNGTSEEFKVFTAGTSKLTIASTGAATFSSSVTASGGKSQFVASGGASAGAGISLNNGLSGSGRRNWFIGTEESVEGDFQIKCSTAAGGVGGTGDTRLAILNNGNVGIGTASPAVTLDVIGGVRGRDFRVTNSIDNSVVGYVLRQGAWVGGGSTATNLSIAAETGNGISFFVNGSSEGPPMFLNSSGNLGIGTASPTKRLDVRASVAGEVAIVSNDRNSAGDYAFVTSLGSNCNNTSAYHYIAATGGADRVYIFGNGNIQNQNNSYGGISDIKLKENIEDASPKLDDLLKVKVRNYNLIGEENKQIGVIAQELEEVFPAMIDESEDFEEVDVPQLDEEGNEVLNEEGEVVTTKERVSKGTTTKSVKYSVFVPMLIKAIQEQQEIINEMRAEIDSLKNQIK
jgi:hypothetical protein